MKMVSKLFMHANGGIGVFWVILFLVKSDPSYGVMAVINLAVALSFHMFLVRSP